MLVVPYGAGGKQKLEICSVVNDDLKTELDSFIKCGIRSFIRSDLTLDYSKEHLTKEIFDPEYEKLKF